MQNAGPRPPAAVDWGRVGHDLLGVPLVCLCVVLGAVILRWLVHRAIDRLVRRTTSRARQRERQRQRMATTGSVLKSATTLTLSLLALLTVMAEVGVPLAPLLASAGVGGIALGFGAQSLVKDFLSGIFMIVEDQYGVGDVVDTGEVIGTVEEVSLRITRLRDFTGVVWYIRNGEIIRIANRSQGWSTAIVDVPVAATEDVDRVLDLVRSAVAEISGSDELADRLIEPPEVAGVQSVSPGVVTLRVTAKCAANESAGVQRVILQRVKSDLDRAGVRQPLPAPPYGEPGATT